MNAADTIADRQAIVRAQIRKWIATDWPRESEKWDHMRSRAAQVFRMLKGAENPRDMTEATSVMSPDTLQAWASFVATMALRGRGRK